MQYKEVMKWPQFEICSFLNMTANLPQGNIIDIIKRTKFSSVLIYNETVVQNTMIMLAEKYKDSLNERLHPCPLDTDSFKEYNISSSLKQPFEYYFPSGEYRYTHRFWNDEDDEIYTRIIYERFLTGVKAMN